MSDTQEIITLRAWLETANTRITQLEQENRYLDSLNYELQFLENRLILELNARIAELQAERDNLSRHLAAGAAWDSPDALVLENSYLKARIAELEKRI